MPDAWISPIVFSLLVIGLCVRLGLLRRHIQHVTQHANAVPAAFAAAITLEAHQKAALYARARSQLSALQHMVDAGWLIWVLWGGGLMWFNQHIAATGTLWSELLLIGALVFAGELIQLPLSLYSTFGIEARFGYNRTTPQLFLADLLRGTLLSIVIGGPLCAAVLMLLAYEQAWLWIWLLWNSFTLGLAAAFPHWIAPLFNQFTPLDNPSLQLKIDALLQRCGLPPRKIYIADSSRRSTRGNAYLAGLGKSQRIVIFDTLLEHLDEAEIEAVLAHELGHAQRHHLKQRMLAGLVLSFILLAGFGYALQHPQQWAPAFGLETERTTLLLWAMISVSSVLGAWIAPLGNFFSRRNEFEADAFAATYSQAEALASALTKLYRDNAATLTPDPLYSAYNDSHPAALDRVGRLLAQSKKE